MDGQNANFSGWAVVELYGRTKETGYVTTQYFGGSAMFQIDVPELPEREVPMHRAGYTDNGWTPEGSIVKREASPARTRLVGPNAVFSINPCSEEVARAALSEACPIIAVVKMAERPQLQASFETEPEEEDEEIPI